MPLHRRTPNGNWIADFYDASGKRQRINTRTKNKTIAQRILDQLTIEDAAGKFGVALATQSIKLETLVDEFAAYLAQSSDMHVTNTEHRIRRVIAQAGWTQARHITQYGAETVVRNLTNERPSKAGQLLSLRSQSHYLTAIKSFTAWLVNVRKILPTDPLAAVKKPSFEHDRRLIRRFLLPAEWYWLAKTPNATLYAVAIQTGYRASELFRLTPASLQGDYLTLPASATKNRQAARQYISPGLRAKLELPFQIDGDEARLAELLRGDLANARRMVDDMGPNHRDFLRPIDANGHVLDFHSLRHTTGAWLAIAGVNPKTIQTIMRHSTITLTLDTYGHLMPGAERDASEIIGKMLGDSTDGPPPRM